MKIKFWYDVTDEVIKREVVEAGKPGGRKRAECFELNELSPASRAHIAQLFPLNSPNGVTPGLLDYRNEPKNEIEITLGVFKAETTLNGQQIVVVSKSFNRSPLTITDCENALADLAASKPPADAEFAKLHAEYTAREQERKAKVAAEERERERYRQAEREQKAKEDARRRERELEAEAERAAWIEQHGSDHLKRALNAGYVCQRKYVTERAALEWDGWTVDFDDKAAWRARACPSVKALDIEQQAKTKADPDDVKIVWLTHPPYKTDEDEYEYSDGDEWQAREAVVVRNYLGKYDLVREV